MSPPFAIALSGLIVTLAVLTIGEFFHLKGAVPIAFLVGGTMMLGGLVVGFIRSILGKRSGK